jgi:hypothetical protein
MTDDHLVLIINAKLSAALDDMDDLESIDNKVFFKKNFARDHSKFFKFFVHHNHHIINSYADKKFDVWYNLVYKVPEELKNIFEPIGLPEDEEREIIHICLLLAKIKSAYKDVLKIGPGYSNDLFRKVLQSRMETLMDKKYIDRLELRAGAFEKVVSAVDTLFEYYLKPPIVK